MAMTYRSGERENGKEAIGSLVQKERTRLKFIWIPWGSEEETSVLPLSFTGLLKRESLRRVILADILAVRIKPKRIDVAGIPVSNPCGQSLHRFRLLSRKVSHFARVRVQVKKHRLILERFVDQFHVAIADRKCKLAITHCVAPEQSLMRQRRVLALQMRQEIDAIKRQ